MGEWHWKEIMGRFSLDKNCPKGKVYIMQDEYCNRCGSKRVIIQTANGEDRMCPANCDSPYMIHNREKQGEDDN